MAEAWNGKIRVKEIKIRTIWIDLWEGAQYMKILYAHQGISIVKEALKIHMDKIV